MRGASKPQNCPVCIGCFRKLEGPDCTPVQTKRLTPGERWQPCELCGGPCDAVPGIYMRLWRPPPEPPGDVYDLLEVPVLQTLDPTIQHTRKRAKE